MKRAAYIILAAAAILLATITIARLSEAADTTWLDIANFAASTLDGAITDSDVSLDVQTGDGAEFPDGGALDFHIVVGDDDQGYEIMKCTARSSDTLTVTRAQEGTAAVAFDDGTAVRHAITKQYITDITTAVTALETTPSFDTVTTPVVKSNADLTLHLDDDNNGSNKLSIVDGADAEVATVSETGALTADSLAIGGGYGSTGVSISNAGVIQANGAGTFDGTLTAAGELAADGESLTCDGATFALLNTVPTTINFGGAATTLNMGAASVDATIPNNLTLGTNAANDGRLTFGNDDDVYIHNETTDTVLSVVAPGGVTLHADYQTEVQSVAFDVEEVTMDADDGSGIKVESVDLNCNAYIVRAFVNFSQGCGDAGDTCELVINDADNVSTPTTTLDAAQDQSAAGLLMYTPAGSTTVEIGQTSATNRYVVVGYKDVGDDGSTSANLQGTLVVEYIRY